MRRYLSITQVRGGFFVDSVSENNFGAVCATLPELLAMIEEFYAPPPVVSADVICTPPDVTP